ncbi:MAG TPA: DUF1801 domain-containing protein [Saprospiraceae bacterium]|nr:DUF1801 domain-containing protein [Saprospiraceae bacterium]
MAELKTKPTKASVSAFLNAIEDEQKRKDSKQLAKLMQEITGHKPVMWGPSIVGFGSYHYKSERSRQEGDWLLTGFSPRVQNLTVYIIAGFDRYKTLMKKLGKCKTGGSCLYFKKLADIDQEVLKELVKESVEYMKKKYS